MSWSGNGVMLFRYPDSGSVGTGPDGVIFDLSSPDHRWPGTAI